MKNKKILRRYDVSESVFDDIVQNMQTRIKVVDNIKDYFKGYPQKHIVVYDNKEYLIIREHILAYFADFSDEEYQSVEDWRQVIVRKSAQVVSYQKNIDGSRAYKTVRSKLLTVYTEEELDQRMKMFEAEKDETKSQFHFQYPSKDCVLAHSNCVKYDINGAHHAALIEIFPKAKELLEDMFNRRKQEPILKAYINYFVGMLTRKGYRKTYNWIVQRVSKQLKDAINYVGGTLVYANTDGFMSSCPENKLTASKEIGKFKLEFEGTAYTYQDKNYWCYQAGKDITGSIRYSVRDQIDLSKGQIVHYDIDRRSLESGVIAEFITNVVKENVNVYKED